MNLTVNSQYALWKTFGCSLDIQGKTPDSIDNDITICYLQAYSVWTERGKT